MRRRKALGLMGEDRVEPEGSPRLFGTQVAETDRYNSISLCDEVFSKENIERAMYLVQKNKGAPGVDGMSVYELEKWWIGKGAEGVFNRVHAASIKRLKGKIRILTKRNRGISLARMLYELKRALTGWINYYGIAKCKGLCEGIDEWMRTRTRQYIWKQWKRQRTKISRLRKFEVDRNQAFLWGLTKKSYWRIANSPVLKTTLTNKYLKEQGMFSMLEYYIKKCVDKRSAVYRSLRTVL